jgi:hypothetical protein
MQLAALQGGITAAELRVVQYDLVICLFYRVSNLCIIVVGLCTLESS